MGWVLWGQDAALALGLIARVAALLPQAHHDALVSGCPVMEGNTTQGLIPSKVGFANANTIVSEEHRISSMAI